ncbi:hypothetical protein C4D60_Mb06t07810 [Musa balbisiana]|uniref:Ufm1-specific protease n=1 Tax=Musa balbisiana TaxID=52838 RepID=A0A4S8INV0_MUSBA|nr:hypothetical protein C4D60_Mb06t07810 [Musa balbisiana]
MEGETGRCVRVLCPKKSLLSSKNPGLRWLIGSPLFLPPFTVVSSFCCLHALHDDDPYSPDFAKEADEIRMLLLRGFNIIGALFVGDGNWEKCAWKAVEASSKMRKFLFGDGDCDLIGAVTDLITDNIHFFVSHSTNVESMEAVSTVVFEDNRETYVWEKGCLLRCELELKLPVFVPLDKTSDVAEIVSSLVDEAAAKLRDPYVAYLVEGSNVDTDELSQSIVLHGMELDSKPDHSDSMLSKASMKESGAKDLACSHFYLKDKNISSSTIRENADAIQIAVLSNQSRNNCKSAVPVAEYFPATEYARNLNVNFKLDVLCYASEDFTIAAALSKLVIPGLIDQLNSIKKAVIPELLSQQPQLCPYHFLPPELLHPITAIYDLRYGETEMKQGEMRRSLHSRLGLPLDRPLLRIANALSFGMKSTKDTHSVKYVSGGIISLIDGSYEYYHYLLYGFDDNGWGCAYRSLQTIISWYRLQQYASIGVPSHREIQQALVDMGDKEPSFVGSRGGVLAYTLLGVDYNQASGDCAFLILDPHYTGNDDLKKIVNGGWCGWKKAIDSKGRNFFLKDKFYNLLLPQRPNMV